jgi:hypothetical protein
MPHANENQENIKKKKKERYSQLSITVAARSKA